MHIVPMMFTKRSTGNVVRPWPDQPDRLLWPCRIKDISVIRTAIDDPKRSAIETGTYLTSELTTPLYSVLRMHGPTPNSYIA